jgi:hypothetical protein
MSRTSYEGARGAFLPEIRLGLRIAIENGAFGSFFVVEDEGDGYFGAVGPFRVE